MRTLSNHIGGREVAAASGATLEVRNPATNAVIGTLPESGPDDVDAAVEAARAALDGAWGRTTAAERADLCDAVADRIEARLDEYRNAGWVIEADDDLEVSVRKALPAGRLDPGMPLSPTLHTITSGAGYGGIVYVTAAKGEGTAANRIAISRVDLPPFDWAPEPSLIEADVADVPVLPAATAPEAADAGKGT